MILPAPTTSTAPPSRPEQHPAGTVEPTRRLRAWPLPPTSPRSPRASGGSRRPTSRWSCATPTGDAGRRPQRAASPATARPCPPATGWSTPTLNAAVSRLEAAGGVRAARGRGRPRGACGPPTTRTPPSATPRSRSDHAGPRPSGGVGGTRTGVKCLHAHYAHLLAGGDDPVGRWTAAQLASADCPETAWATHAPRRER